MRKAYVQRNQCASTSGPAFHWLRRFFYFRDDFPRNLPHLQPFRGEHVVEPCLSPLPLQEAYSNEGLFGLLHRLETWLHRAAADNLVAPGQGWEPVRRDTLADELIANTNHLRALGLEATSRVLAAGWRGIKLWDGNAYSRQHFLLRVSAQSVPLVGASSLEGWMAGDGETGQTICLVIPCARKSNGDIALSGEFFGGPVKGLAGLVTEGARIGLDQPLSKMLAAISGLWSCAWKGFPLGIALAVKRPLTLVGSDTDVELISFVCRSGSDGRFDNAADVEVSHARLSEDVSPELLRMMSGAPVPVRNLGLIGLGSLGSKVFMHELRRGAAPATAIDYSHFRPHHAARHVLTPRSLAAAVDGAEYKAFALRRVANEFGVDVKAYPADALHVLGDVDLRRELCPSASTIILNTTGAASVRLALSGATPSELPGQVIEAGLTAGGGVGIIVEEGERRNPSTLDLYTMAQVDLAYHPSAEEAFGVLDQIIIGEGCASPTLAVSDGTISAFAGVLSERIGLLRSAERGSASGRFFVVSANGLARQVTRRDVDSFQIVHADDAPEWTVRLAPSVATKIIELARAAAPKETGGYLIGRAFEMTRVIVVVAFEPAPAGSISSVTQFVLAARRDDGLPELTKGGLEVVGTWHSHTSPSGPSSVDRQSAAIIQDGDGRARTLLIRHPAGWRALVTHSGGKTWWPQQP